MKIVIKNVTGDEQNEWCLYELSHYAGIKVGNIIEHGKFDPQNNSVSFSIGEVDCVAWIGETCEIIEENAGK